MMAGLPAVVSDVGELGALVVDGETGYTVERGHVERFAERARELVEDEARWSTFSRRARQRALAACATERVSERWTDVLTVPTGDGERQARCPATRA
jgi:glycosyltransferase involved in cell wall biosynthesis